jgi:hypothetical protein
MQKTTWWSVCQPMRRKCVSLQHREVSVFDDGWLIFGLLAPLTGPARPALS